MDKRCHINNEIHLNLAHKFSNKFEDSEREGIRDEIRRNLCGGLQTHKHSDGNYYCIFHLPNKDKNVEEFRGVAGKAIIKIQNQIKQLNSLPDNEKELAKAKVKYDFRYVQFPCAFGFRGSKVDVEIDFSHATFFDVADFMRTEFFGYANFDSVSFHKLAYFIFAKFQANAYFFSANLLGKADFKYTFFSNGKFTKAIFSEKADFESSEFGRHANFIEATFVKEANFKHSKLFIANFENAMFSDLADFESAEFLDSANFKGSGKNLIFIENAVLNLQDAKVEKPDRVTFHTVNLRPNWFVNVDPRKFVFIDINWKNLYWNWQLRNRNIQNELQQLSNRDIKEQNKRLFEIAVRRLAVNAEENNLYEDAAKFRSMAMETRRLEEIKRVRLSRYLTFLYKWTSGYGESWSWAAGVLLLLILIIFPIIYTRTGFITCSSDRPIATSLTICETKDEEVSKSCTCSKDQITFTDAIIQSLTTATLQNVDYRKPLNWRGELWIILEKIFAPLQAALLALAIRRKFMR